MGLWLWSLSYSTNGTKGKIIFPIVGSLFRPQNSLLLLHKSIQKLRNHFLSSVLVVLPEDLRLHEILVKLASLFDFALHKLTTEPVVLVYRLQKLFFGERL
jgi:hypothetical protein